jgi:AbrB family looped-hinge helix DNA binding protein
MSTISKVTVKYQATIPQEVREFLGIKQGDTVTYEIEAGEVRLRRATPLDLAYHGAVAATLTEWNSKTDDDAYRDL